jgi:hypothetical protein
VLTAPVKSGDFRLKQLSALKFWHHEPHEIFAEKLMSWRILPAFVLAASATLNVLPPTLQRASLWNDALLVVRQRSNGHKKLSRCAVECCRRFHVAEVSGAWNHRQLRSLQEQQVSGPRGAGKP